MSTMLWCLLYLFTSLIYKWILSWGGAKYIQGWKSSFFLNMESGDWNEEQIKAMVLLIWIGSTILFVVGLIYPELRF
ncbi:hypothetical protein [Acinetobacter sp. MD2(2019)]|uniref:hypothetical protein n=1 Tax=Acinetobacter sp. MD2(2019) TaxID=2605273 RepID=UPI002D1F03ED|nr:hypothetical protein [Acinetobacter sp. MD2(2019)]MEB3752997.1 hypothetical protein [Acinetobacter sp. MD2(2019)]